MYILTALVYVTAWVCTPFVDWYRLHVFPLWQRPISSIMSYIPFSVGEIMIVFLVIIVIVMLSACIISLIRRKNRKKTLDLCARISLVILLFVFMTETFNCFVFYHATTVEEEKYSKVEYTPRLLFSTYNHVVRSANELAETFARDENGDIIYEGDIQVECQNIMEQFGKEYPLFEGKHPKAKKMLFSDLMTQQYMCGVYFPFSLEANYNKNMCIGNDHFTICHELTHLRGVIYEDEANYYSFLACVNSDNPMAQYSGYLNVMDYLYSDCIDLIDANEDIALKYFEGIEERSSYVDHDNEFVPLETMERIEDESVISTETVDEVSDAFYDTNLKINGVENGMISYSEVVKLLMGYYSEKMD